MPWGYSNISVLNAKDLQNVAWERSEILFVPFFYQEIVDCAIPIWFAFYVCVAKIAFFTDG